MAKIGEWSGSWLVLDDMGHGLFWCRCSCGREKAMSEQLLATKGKSRNCSHARKDGSRRNPNSLRYHPLYPIWHSMMARCYNEGRKDYPKYGAKGVGVCEHWHMFENFVAGIADIGPRPSRKHELDRFPNKVGNYEPGNVRWATRSQSARNRRNNRFITANGQTKTVAEWAEITGLSFQLIVRRIDVHGWSEEDAVTVPARSWTRKEIS